MAHGEIVSIPLVGTWSLRPVFVTDSSDFEGLLKLPKHRHPFPLSHFMDFHVRCVRRVQNLLDSSQRLGRTPWASQVTLHGHNHANPSSLTCYTVHVFAYTQSCTAVKHSPTLLGYFVTSRGSTHQPAKAFFPRAAPLFFGIQRDASWNVLFNRLFQFGLSSFLSLLWNCPQG